MRDSSKPLDALTVKRHKEGLLGVAASYQGLRLVANNSGTKPGLSDINPLERN